MTVPEAVRPLLDGSLSLLQARFPKRLEAVYVIGSLAHGGWSLRASDVDVCVLLSDPWLDGDGPGLVAVAGELAERFPRLGPRLSLFCATPAILRGEAAGGRLGLIDAVDLAQNGQLLWGSEVRSGLRRLSDEELLGALYEDLVDRWGRRTTPFDGREALETGSGSELDERTLVKACLYPGRFLHTAETGRIAGNEEASRFFAARFGEGRAQAVRLAIDVRGRAPGSDLSAPERESLAAAFRPLYALLFEELRSRYGLEKPRS